MNEKTDANTFSKNNNHFPYRGILASAAMLLLACSPIILATQPAFAQVRLILRTTEDVYLIGQTLEIYGTAEPNDVLVIRLFDPSGNAIKFDNVQVDEEGFFREPVFKWPEPSRTIPYGTYVVEATPSEGVKVPQSREVTFAEATTGDGQVPITHNLGIKLDAPAEVAVGAPFRIFVQVTYDGVLVNSENEEQIRTLLGASHIHSETSTILLTDKFTELHDGLFYTDVTLEREGPYVIHAAAFHRGFLSHDSRVVTAGTGSFSTIQETVNKLATTLNSTQHELSEIQTELDETKEALEDTQSSITQSVNDARSKISEDIQVINDASGQVNSLILPVLALISVIIALQISLFARIRASYR